MILRVNKSKETESSTKDKPDEENSLSTKESFTGKIGVTIGDLDNYKKDSLINIWIIIIPVTSTITTMI